MADVDIEENDRYCTATAAGGETNVPADFPIYDESEILVERTRAGVKSTLSAPTHFTVTNVGVEAGFILVLASAATADDYFEVWGKTRVERVGAYSQSNFQADALNRELDRNTWIDQERQRDINLAKEAALLAAKVACKGFWAGRMAAGERLLIDIATEAQVFGAHFAGSRSYLGTAPESDWVVTIKKNGATIGTVTHDAGEQHGVFNITGSLTRADADILEVIAPPDSDPAAADYALTLVSEL